MHHDKLLSIDNLFTKLIFSRSCNTIKHEIVFKIKLFSSQPTQIFVSLWLFAEIWSTQQTVGSSACAHLRGCCILFEPKKAKNYALPRSLCKWGAFSANLASSCTNCEFFCRVPQNASRAGTPGFRAPEVLMKYPDQTTGKLYCIQKLDWFVWIYNIFNHNY